MIRCAWCGADTTHRPRISFFILNVERNVTICQDCATSADFQARFPRENGPACAPATSAARSATCPVCHRSPRTVYTTASGTACAQCLEEAVKAGRYRSAFCLGENASAEDFSPTLKGNWFRELPILRS